MARKAARRNLLNLKDTNLVILGAAAHRLNVAAEDECTAYSGIVGRLIFKGIALVVDGNWRD